MPLLSQLKEKIGIIILWPPGTKLVQAGASQGSRSAVPKPTPLLVRLGSLAWAPQESRCLKSKGFDLWKKKLSHLIPTFPPLLLLIFFLEKDST